VRKDRLIIPLGTSATVSVRNRAGAHAIFTPGRGTALSGGGMALYVDLPLKRDDAIDPY